MLRHRNGHRNYPDDIMPDSHISEVYERDIGYAEAETEAKAKSAIPKYGEKVAFTLDANFAINI